MKKIFTLAALAAMTLVAGAQETVTEKWSATKATTNDEGAVVYDPIDDYSVLGEEGAASIVKIECEHFTGEHVSGPIKGYIDAEQLNADGKLDYEVNNGWSKKTTNMSKDGSVAPLTAMQGMGNPVNLDLVTFDPIMDEDGVTVLKYRANWDSSYYKADGSTGGPKHGTYVSVTPKIDGTMKVGVWVNKGNRNIYVCDNVDYIAKTYGTDVKVSGCINGQTWTDEDTTDENLIGYMKVQPELKTKAQLALEADPVATPGEGDYYIIGQGNQVSWVWMTFDVKKDVTYYVFNHNTQIGLMDVEFTYSAGDTAISNIESSNANSTVSFNLAGQKVSSNYKGIVVKNGKKVVVK